MQPSGSTGRDRSKHRLLDQIVGNGCATGLTDREPGALEGRQCSLDSRSPPCLHVHHVLDRYRARNDGEQARATSLRRSTRSQTVRHDAPGIQFEMLAGGQEVQPERRATRRRPRLDCSILGDLRVQIPGESKRILSLERTELDLEQSTGIERATERSE